MRCGIGTIADGDPTTQCSMETRRRVTRRRRAHRVAARLESALAPGIRARCSSYQSDPLLETSLPDPGVSATALLRRGNSPMASSEIIPEPLPKCAKAYLP